MKLEECLRRLHYHWFWGLREVSTNFGCSLWLQVETWKTSPEVVVRIREKQREISRKIGIIRFFYWLFNIANYAEDDYKLKAYDAVLMEEQGMFDWEKSKAVASYVAGSMTGVFRQVASVLPRFESSGNRFSAGAGQISVYSRTESSNVHSEPGREFTAPIGADKEKMLRVSQEMLQALQVLGIRSAVGTSMSFRVIRVAYLQKAIDTHPDKNPSAESTVDFQNIVRAYEELKAAFEGRPLMPNTNLSRTTEELFKDFQELSKSFERLAEDFRGLAESFRRLCKSFDEIAEDYRGIQRQCRWILKEQDRQDLILDELARQTVGRVTVSDSKAPDTVPTVPPVSVAPFMHNYGSINGETSHLSSDSTSTPSTLVH